MSVKIGRSPGQIVVNVNVSSPDVNVNVEPGTTNVTVESEGSKKSPLKKDNLTADGSEQTVIEATGLSLLEGYLDLQNMQAGDTVLIKQYVKVEEGGDYKLVDNGSYSDVQTKPILHFLSRILDLGMKITLQQTAGTYKSFPHAFYKED